MIILQNHTKTYQKNTQGAYMSKRKQKAMKRAMADVVDFYNYEGNTVIHREKKSDLLKARNESQQNYIDVMEQDVKKIVFGVGPAGTGKTLLAVQHAVKSLGMGKVEKIVITRPTVTADEQLGFLPGNINKKMDPWTRPIFDVFKDTWTNNRIQSMISEGIIEISPLAYMRGRTFKNAVIIADEMQNATPSQLKMLLTRLGDDSKIILTGDLQQSDRRGQNGLEEFMSLVQTHEYEYIDICEFSAEDIERHPAVIEVLNVYGVNDTTDL